MSRLISIVISLVLMNGLGFSSQSEGAQGSILFDPTQKYALSYHDESVVMRLEYEKNSLAVNVANRRKSTSGKVNLPAEIVQVTQIVGGAKDKALVLGMVSGSVFDVVVINTSSIAISDQFLAYSPSVSPNGRFVAFVKFYPPHFVDGTDDHYLLYDLERSALESRPAGTGASDRTNVGAPIFPTIGNQSGDNTGIPPQRQHHMGAQRFFWDSDSERYAFVDDYDSQLHLIVGATNGALRGAHGVTIAKREICSDVKTESCEVTLVDAEFAADGVVARFHSVGSYSSLRQSIRYRNQQLAPLP